MKQRYFILILILGLWGISTISYRIFAQDQPVGRLSDYRQTDAYYNELHRPQFHFTPPMNWMNDPNGMVYFDGEYHLFYQHNPHGNTWGHMSWGHAVSPDLVHWEHLPIALQDHYGVMIFSGSAVVDFKNTSGFGNGELPPLVAIYTGHGHGKQTQDIAYSNDRGRTWTKYAGNPVIDLNMSDFRDPKVFWHEASEKWVMTVSMPLERKVRFYSSHNLKEWDLLSEFGPAGAVKGIWECPDLFPVEIEGTQDSKWVLIVNIGSGAIAGGSGCQYFIGDFDGTRFIVDEVGNQNERQSARPTGRVIADFEGDSFGEGWVATGASFAPGPIKTQDPFSGYLGKGLATSWGNGDVDQGALRSPEIKIDGNYIHFLIGGGNHPGEACFNLLINGEVVRTATGTNSGMLQWHSWDVTHFNGKQAVLEVLDQHSGGWGQIFVDHIVMGDEPFEDPGEPALWVDYGKDFYAAVSWADVPAEDGRRLWLGWMSNWQYANNIPTHPWRSAMSIPRSLHLRSTPDGLKLVQRPVHELRKLRGERTRMSDIEVGPQGVDLRSKGVVGKRLEIVIDIDPGTSGEFGIRLRKGGAAATVVGYEVAREQLYVDRTQSGDVSFHDAFSVRNAGPLSRRNGSIRLHLFLDDSSVEVFGNRGETVLSERIFPSPEHLGVELFSNGGTAHVKRLRAWELDSIWHKP